MPQICCSRSRTAPIAAIPLTTATQTTITHHYTIVQSNALPVVDLSHSVRATWMSQGAFQYVDDLLPAMYRSLPYFYSISVALLLLALLVPVNVGIYLSVLSFCLGLPALAASWMVLRPSMLRLLVTTYEFWFFSIVNLLTFTTIALYIYDARVIGLGLYWFLIQNNIVVDANLRAIRRMTVTTISAIPSLGLLALLCGLQLIPGAVDYSQSLNGRQVSAIDMSCNGLVTLMIFLARVVFRKRKALMQDIRGWTIVCVVYRARMKLQLIQNDLPPIKTTAWTEEESDAMQTRVAVRTKKRPTYIQQLHVERNELVIDAAQFVVPWVQLPLRSLSSFHTVALYGIGAIGLFVSLAVLSLTVTTDQDHDQAIVLAIIGLVCTLVFCGFFFVFAQKQVLRLLLQSFDFIFPSLQFSLSSICTMDAFAWDYRWFAVVASWFWLHWILTLDAYTPVVRHRLRFPMRRCVVPILVIFLVSQTWFLVELTLDRRWELYDRVLWKTANAEFCLMAFLLSRLLTMLLWCSRMLWKVWTSQPDDLLLLQGQVWYHNYLALDMRRKTHEHVTLPRSARERGTASQQS